MKRIFIVTLIGISLCIGSTRVYDVEPFGNCNGKVYGPYGITQVFTCVCDSFLWAEVFIGAVNAQGEFFFSIEEFPNGNPIAEGYSEVGPGTNYQNIRAFLTQLPNHNIIKGKQYKLRITYASIPSDSINFYYDTTNSYSYGYMIGSSGPEYNKDLAARIEGVNRVDSFMFGINSCMGTMGQTFTLPMDTTGWNVCCEKMRNMGISWDRQLGFLWRQPDSASSFIWQWSDSVMTNLTRESIRAIPQVGIELPPPTWAWHSEHWPDSSETVIPYVRNLFLPVIINDSINPQNYFANWVYNLVKRYCPGGTFWQENPAVLPIEYLEFGGEPNLQRVPTSCCFCLWDSCCRDSIYRKIESTYVLTYGSQTGRIYFRDTLWYRGFIVAESAAKRAYPNIKILSPQISTPWIGGRGNELPNDWWWATNPLDFLRKFYNWGLGSNINIITASLYQQEPHDQYFDPLLFKSAIDSIRTVMDNNGDFNKELWGTEYGFTAFPGHATEINKANAVLEAYVSTIDPTEEPFRKPNRIAWFYFTKRYYHPANIDSGFPLTDRDFTEFPAYYAYKQLSENIKNKSFNCRIKDTLNTFYTYEFEDNAGKKFWIAWKQSGQGEPATIKFPVRTDTALIEEISYNSNTSITPQSASSDGYLYVTIDTTPKYLIEPLEPIVSRPDLMISSLKVYPETLYAQKPCTLKCWVRDTSSRQTPINIAIPITFYHNGIYLDTAIINGSIAGHDSILITKIFQAWSIDSTSSRAQDTILLKAVVNESKNIMELNFDNNSKYKLTKIKHYFQPDLQIKNSYDSLYIGDNIYNTDGASQTKTQKVQRRTAYYNIKIENDGEFYRDSVIINGPSSDSFWQVRYIYNDTNNTDNTTFWLYVQKGSAKYVTMKVTPSFSTPDNDTFVGLVTATSGYDQSKIDVVKTITISSNPWQIQDTLVADRSTGPNQGRHLTRVPNTDELHMVFEGDDGVIYAFSDNGGLTWDYENLGPGNFPCIGINYKQQPWIAFIRDGSLICKIKREDGSFKDVFPFERAENLWAGPPSIALATIPIKEEVHDYAYIVYPVYESDSMPKDPNPEPPDSLTASYIYVTLFDTAGTKDSTVLDIKTDPNIPLSHACVGVTPADLIHIAWQQGDEIWYTTNAEPVTPENWQDVSWLEPYDLSQTPEIVSEHPFVESYGDIVYVVWKEGDPGEIIEKNRYVWEPSEYEKWSDPINLSNSQENSDNPQMSTGDVCVWQEIENGVFKVYSNICTKIICLTPNANNVLFANTNAMVTDPKAPEIVVYYSYTDEISGDTLHEVKIDKYCFPDGLQGDQKQVQYYDGLVGDTIASPYCETRTGFIDYGDFQIDYGNQLEYMLKYFDPSKHYQLQVVVYQDTGGMIRQTLEVEDTLEASIRIYPAAPETINIIISPTTYQEDLASALDIIKTRGVFASLADFKVYEYEVLNDSGSSGSGQQSAGLERLPIPTALHMPKPNPFANQIQIKFQIPVKTKVDLKIYNSAGRLVNKLISGETNAGYYTMTWNGKDERELSQPNGIYFIRLKTNDYDMTKKMVMVK